MTSAPRRPHHLPLLRGRVRRARDAGRAGRRDDRRRSGASGEFRAAVLEGRGARRDARARARGCCIRCCASTTARSRAPTGIRRSARVADGFQRIVERDGPDAVAFYLSGQLLTEDYYVANKLMKGFLGSANVDTNSRLCMASSVAGHRRAFGADTVPGLYRGPRSGRPDRAGRLERRMVPSGSVPAHAGQPARARREAGRDRSAPHRDRRRGRPASRHRARHGHGAVLRPAGAARRPRRVRSRATWRTTPPASRPRCSARARSRRISRPSRSATGLDAADVAAFYELFAATPRIVTCYSQGVNQSAQGTDKVNAIINCHLATGRIGKPGMGPFSLTGQPNAMGGREVGGLANQLAAHMNFSARRDRPRAPLLGCAAHRDARRPQGRARCSRRSSAARSRRCG